MKKHLVVSNHNSDLEWLTTTYDYGFSPDNIIIYDRSDEEKDWSHLGTSIRSPNVGENIYDIMRYIVEYYDDLPDVAVFIKGNMFQRPEERGGAEYYTTVERFYRALQAEYFLPIERFHETTEFIVNGGGFIQPRWEALSNQTIYTRHFATMPDMMRRLFKNPPSFRYNRFAPGGNYVVPKANILKFSKAFYKKLKFFVSYEPPEEFQSTSGEAYLIERLLYMMWTEDLQELDE
tara:strand:- start:3801 stop:4502 length:702 start_codon:yes stop_codon:yes gene_type:complete